MNAKHILRWVIVLFLLAALPAITAVMAQDDFQIQLNDYELQAIGYDLASEKCAEHLWHFTMPKSGYVLIDIKSQGVSADYTQVCLEGSGKPNCSPKGSRTMIFYGLEAGDYQIRVGGGDTAEEDGICFNYTLILASPLLISASLDNSALGMVDTIPFQAGDILAWTRLVKGGSDHWWLLFDASDVGITKNVSNIASNGVDELLLSLGANQTLPGVGQVTPYDIFIFDPTSFGDTTAGTFRWGLQGHEHGLTQAGEALDAIDGWVNGNDSCYGFPISITGIVNVPSWNNFVVRADDEDVICKVYNGNWEPWRYFFDVKGNKNAPDWWVPNSVKLPGLPREDVIALAYDDTTDVMYMTIQGRGTVLGHVVTQKDIFAINYPGYTWGGVVWHGPDHGWNYNIDAFEFSGN